MSEVLIHDVVIAGAGPVGLLLACELRRGGASVLVLERAAQPQTPLKALPFGARGLSAPTIDALYRRGVLATFLDAAPRKPAASAGHFAGIPFYHDQIDTAAWPYRVDGPAPLILATTMAHVEAVLAAQATSLGATIRRGVTVDGVGQVADGMTVHAGGERLQARWLVGCDGGRSIVRQRGGFAFAGTAPEFTGYSLQLALRDPALLPAGRHYTAGGMVMHQPPGIVALVDFDGGAAHRTPLTAAHVQDVLRRVSGQPVTVDSVELGTTWTDRAYQASTYRQGRVLLAGDAAHIHAPLGGQGLNLGLGDAMNLGWKLAATIRGDAPAGLLDSYTAERHPVAAAVLDWSRAQVALMRPGAGTRALAAIMRDLIATSDGATYVAQRVWGVDLAYDLGGTHPLVGRSVPDFALADGTRCGDHLRGARGLLLDFHPGRPLRAVAARWPRHLAYLGLGASDTLGCGAVLVRPDGIVAWVGATDPDPGQASEAAQRWFGAPDQAPAAA